MTFRTLVAVAVLALSNVVTLFLWKQYSSEDFNSRTPLRAGTAFQQKHVDANSPLIFVGGVPRSGTTLMRAILDAHDEIHCGPETHILPIVFNAIDKFSKKPAFTNRMREAGISDDLLARAISAFTMEIMMHRNTSVPGRRLCNKDPMMHRNLGVVLKAFPNAKCIQMVRDGRAMVYSAITRGVGIKKWNLKDPEDCLRRWNSLTARMASQCQKAGRERCLQVPYELLVQQPEKWTKIIAEFIGIPWRESMLHHEAYVGVKGGVDLSLAEKSTDQVVKPIYVNALTNWTGFYSDSILRDMHNIAPHLAKLGYHPHQNPPDYAKYEMRDLTAELGLDVTADLSPSEDDGDDE